MNEDDWSLGVNGISIATDGILEKCPPVHLAETTVYVNIRTLVRNALSCYKLRGNPDAVTKVYERVKADIACFNDVLSTLNSVVNVYSVNYEKLPKKGLVNYVVPSTPKQIAADAVYKSAIELCMDLVDTVFSDGKAFNRPPEYLQPSAAIVTHYAHDLVTATKINLTLIESHTGTAKRRGVWNTKLGLTDEGKEYIPFNPLMYYIFGDKGKNYVGPLDKDVRNKIYNIAKKYDWTPATTDSRVLFCLQQADNSMYEFVKNFNRI